MVCHLNEQKREINKKDLSSHSFLKSFKVINGLLKIVRTSVKSREHTFFFFGLGSSI